MRQLRVRLRKPFPKSSVRDFAPKRIVGDTDPVPRGGRRFILTDGRTGFTSLKIRFLRSIGCGFEGVWLRLEWRRKTEVIIAGAVGGRKISYPMNANL